MRIDALEWPGIHRVAQSDFGDGSHSEEDVTKNSVNGA